MPKFPLMASNIGNFTTALRKERPGQRSCQFCAG